jgi:hypothetical protein
MQKKGQITIFMIMGLLILVTVFSFIYLNNYMKEKQLEQEVADKFELDLNSEKIKNRVEWCINDLGEKAILTLGFYGGKKELVGNFFDEEVFDANYLYYLGEEQTSSVEEMEDSLSIMLDERLEDCLGEVGKPKLIDVEEDVVSHDLIFESFQVEKGEVDTTTKIVDESVLFTVKWPLELKFKNQEKEMIDFPITKVKADLKRGALFLEDFMERIKEQPYYIDVIYLLENNYTTDVSLFNNDTYIFLVTDNNSIINHEPLRFLFASKVDIEGVFE